jgi:hypothetical protein
LSRSRWRERHADLVTWVRVHFFRFWTATVVVIFFALCFWYAPEFLTGWQRIVLNLIQNGSRMLPYPWSDRVQFIMINFGASIWLQFTLGIILLRVLLWPIGRLWRRRQRRGSPIRSTEPEQNHIAPIAKSARQAPTSTLAVVDINKKSRNNRSE